MRKKTSAKNENLGLKKKKKNVTIPDYSRRRVPPSNTAATGGIGAHTDVGVAPPSPLSHDRDRIAPRVQRAAAAASAGGNRARTVGQTPERFASGFRRLRPRRRCQPCRRFGGALSALGRVRFTVGHIDTGPRRPPPPPPPAAATAVCDGAPARPVAGIYLYLYFYFFFSISLFLLLSFPFYSSAVKFSVPFPPYFVHRITVRV